MLKVPEISQFDITRDEIVGQAFEFTKQGFYEAAVTVIRSRISVLVDAVLAELVDDREAIYGEFEWNDETTADVVVALPQVAPEFLNEFVIGTQIWHAHERGQVAFIIAGEIVTYFEVEPGARGRFLSPFGITAHDYTDGGVSESPPAAPPPPPAPPALPAPVIAPPPSGPLQPLYQQAPPPAAAPKTPANDAGEAVPTDTMVKVYALIGQATDLAPKRFAHGLGVSPGTLGNYFTGRTKPKGTTPEQVKFVLAELDMRMGRLQEAAMLLSGAA